MVQRDNSEGDDNRAGGTPVNVNVTPVFVEHPNAICRIEPATDADARFVNCGMITLPHQGGPYRIQFHLQNGDAPDLVFDEQRPWSCREGACPDIDDHDNRQFPTDALAVENHGKMLRVRATPSGRNARHYSLNFDGGMRFDPVIIHN